MITSKDQKISVSVGCTDFLLDEIENLRDQNRILSAEKRVMDNFFNLVARIGQPLTQGYGEDKLWQAKQEINQAIKASKE